MLCPMCSSEIVEGGRRCGSCGVVLPQQVPLGNPNQGLGFREGVAYLTPTHHYSTPAIDTLRRLVNGLLDGEELFIELEAHLQLMAQSFAQFEERHASDMQALLAQESARFPEDDYNASLSYLLRRGLQIFEDGCQAFDTFFDTESDDANELERAFELVREGHDYICYALELANERLQALQEVVADLESLDEDEEYVFVEVPEDDEDDFDDEQEHDG